MSKSVLIPLPQHDFDPSEVSIPARYLRKAGFEITFAVPDPAQPHAADPRMVTGVDLPRLLKGQLMATPEAVAAYHDMETWSEFQHPIAYTKIDPSRFDALMLPGGHAKGMRTYLDSVPLQGSVARFFDDDKPIGAICHGTLLAARTISKSTKADSGKPASVLWGRKTTGLTWGQEMIAWSLTKRWLDDYYRTYPIPMQTELVSLLKSPTDYDPGPGNALMLRLFPGLPARAASDSWVVPSGRATETNCKAGFTVRDRNYLSARWPGDAHKFGSELVALIRGNVASDQTQAAAV
jgi:protease I